MPTPSFDQANLTEKLVGGPGATTRGQKSRKPKKNSSNVRPYKPKPEPSETNWPRLPPTSRRLPLALNANLRNLLGKS